MRANAIRANARTLPLADESVDLVVTSPPYHGLRSYRDNGAHYDGQIGSEAHPQEFLEALWAVTAELWRVLKPTGTVFINLGDRRSGSGGHNNSGIGASPDRGPARYGTVHARGKTGREPRWTRENAAWLAGVIDCDGCIHVGQPRADVASARATVVVEMGDPEVCNRAALITGVGVVRATSKGTCRWEATGPQGSYVLEQIWPWLVIKQKQALAAIEMCRLKVANYGRNVVSPDELNYRAAIAQAISDWNQRRPNDWQPPPCAYPRLPFYEWAPRQKSKLLLPHRYAIGCEDGLADPEGIGWIVRQDIVWSKPSALPESVVDRTRDCHEYWFQMNKQGRYYSAIDEIRTEHAPKTLTHRGGGVAWGNDDNPDNHWGNGGVRAPNPLGALPGSVWTIASEPLIIPDAVKAHYGLPDHFAAFPQEWPRRLILGWSPGGVCTACGEGRRPVVEIEREPRSSGGCSIRNGDERGVSATSILRTNALPDRTITGYACACPDTSAPTRSAVVLDPFCGTGTVLGVAEALGRTGIGVDLSMDYARLAKWRVEKSGHFAKTNTRTWRERQGAFDFGDVEHHAEAEPA